MGAVMEYGRLYGDLFAHPGMADLTNAQVGVWARCLSWAICHHETGGFLPWSVPRMFADGEADLAGVIATLEATGRWEPVDRGWQIHNWATRQPDVARFEQIRQDRRRGGLQSAAARRELYGTAQPRAASELQLELNGEHPPELPPNWSRSKEESESELTPPKPPPYQGGAGSSGNSSNRRPQRRRREPTAREEIAAWLASKQAAEPPA